MYRTLGEWGRKGIGHWVNGIGEEKKSRVWERAGIEESQEMGREI